MPNKEYNVLGLKFNLNPCAFNMKEHTIIVSSNKRRCIYRNGTATNTLLRAS